MPRKKSTKPAAKSFDDAALDVPDAEASLDEIEAAVNAIVDLTEPPEAAPAPQTQTPPTTHDEATTGDETIEPPVMIVLPEPRAGQKAAQPLKEPEPSQTIDQIDDALAHDGDEMIESAFASVEDLLGDSTDEEPEPSQDQDTTERSVKGEADAPSDDGADTSDASPDPIEEKDVAETTETPNATEVESRRDHEPSVASLLKSKESQDRNEKSDRPEPEVPSLDAEFLPARSGHSLSRERLLAACASALAALSWPLQYLPAWIKPAMSWIALSLAFWVPVVWVIALFVVGR